MDHERTKEDFEKFVEESRFPAADAEAVDLLQREVFKAWPANGEFYEPREFWAALKRLNDADVLDPIFERLEERAIRRFMAATPAYHPTKFNAEAIIAFIKRQVGHDVPWTEENYAAAYEELTRRGALEKAPAVAAPEPDAADAVRGPVFLAPVPETDAELDEVAALRAAASDPGLTSAQRREAEEKIRRLAVRQRTQLSTRPAGADPATGEPPRVKI